MTWRAQTSERSLLSAESVILSKSCCQKINNPPKTLEVIIGDEQILSKALLILTAIVV